MNVRSTLSPWGDPWGKTLREWGGKLGVALLTIVVLAVTLEFGTWIYEVTARPAPRDAYELRTGHLSPLRDAPFYSRPFVVESITHGKWYTPEGTGLILPEDHAGRYFNIENARRRTSFQPSAAHHTVYLLGGSTLQGAEVPDDHTIASRLQLLLRETHGDRYRVENLGVVSANIRQETERLEGLELEKGDIVVFYDGVNDATLALYHRVPEGWIKANRRDMANLARRQKLMVKVYNRLKLHSSFVRHVLRPFRPRPLPEHLAGGKVAPELLAELELIYGSNLLRAARYCRQADVAFHHFLQPHLFTLKRLTDYESNLRRNLYLVPAGMETALGAGYPVLRRAMNKVRRRGVVTQDLSHVLDGRADGDEVFLDFCHVTHRANQRIAESLAREIFD